MDGPRPSGNIHSTKSRVRTISHRSDATNYLVTRPPPPLCHLHHAFIPLPPPRSDDGARYITLILPLHFQRPVRFCDGRQYYYHFYHPHHQQYHHHPYHHHSYHHHRCYYHFSFSPSLAGVTPASLTPGAHLDFHRGCLRKTPRLHTQQGETLTDQSLWPGPPPCAIWVYKGEERTSTRF